MTPLAWRDPAPASARDWHRRSGDIDEQAALLPDWPQEYLQLERGPLESWVRGVELDAPITVFEKHTDRRLHKRFATPASRCGVAVLAPSSAAVSFQGRLAAPGSALLLPPGEDFDLVCHGRFDVGVVLVETERLQAWIGSGPCFAAGVLPASPRLARFQALLTQTVVEASSDAAWRLEAALFDLLERERPAAAQGMTPGAGSARPPSTARSRRAALDDARRLLLEQVEAGGDAGSLDRVARQLDVSTRWLHEAFRRHWGLPPRQYLQQLRLARTRADLKRAPADASTVAAVAMKWGFSHLGRFAGQYKCAFGELPSETMRLGRGRAV